MPRKRAIAVEPLTPEGNQVDSLGFSTEEPEPENPGFALSFGIFRFDPNVLEKPGSMTRWLTDILEQTRRRVAPANPRRVILPPEAYSRWGDNRMGISQPAKYVRMSWGPVEIIRSEIEGDWVVIV